jgi:uncharacterized membrane protein YbhN (UPF0104 family)
VVRIALAAAEQMTLASALGDLRDWVSGVLDRIGEVPVLWLVLALGLKTVESALIGLTWRNILRAAYPKSNLSFKTSWGASQGGTAINAVAPAQAGTAAMIGIFRGSIPGSSVSGITSATVVQAAFFTVTSVLIVICVAVFRPHSVAKGSPSNELGDFFFAHPAAIAITVLVVVPLLWFLWRRLKPRVLDQWEKAKQGAAIFRDWRRYGREVALPSAASYCCRIGVNVVFMAAFEIPITVFTVLLVASSHLLSQLFAITPGGVGQTQALDVVILRSYASSEKVAAFSIAQDSVITVWNVLLGIGVMLWAFGLEQTRELLSRKARKQAAADG